MAITPSTNLFLLKVPLEIDNKNQITFNNKTEQLEYFLSLDKLEVDNFQYQRKDSIIRYPAHIDSIMEYNYCIYQNENYTDKWFYSFITGMRYINNNMTEIAITTDVWQTWQFDLEFKESFVEREMINVTEDIPGANLEPEGLETGEFIVGGTPAELPDLSPVAVIAYSRNPYEDGFVSEDPQTQGCLVNGIPTGIFFNVCSFKNLNGILELINKNHGDAILSVFTVPACAVVGYNGVTLETLIQGGEGSSFWIALDFKADKITNTFVSTPEEIDGYIPKNQKLRTYPYLYLGFNPQNGTSKIFRYENFENGTPIFDVYSEVNPNPSVYFVPQNYRKQNGNSMSDICSLNGFPTLSWYTDVYNTWLAQNNQIISLQAQQEQFNYDISTQQNKVALANNITNSALSAGTAIANENTINISQLVGGFFSSANLGLQRSSLAGNHEFYIANLLAQKEKQQMLPNQATLSSSNATLLGYNLMNDNIFTRYTIKSQFAEKIDDFFDMYGYLTNKLKIPNLNNRPNWNYVKTIGINIHAFIPQSDLQAIKNMFDSGITLWHNTNTFLDYSQNNRL